MASLLLSVAGAAVGNAVAGPIGAIAGRSARRRGRQHHRPLVVRRRRQGGTRAAACGSRRHGVDRGRADRARLWPRAVGRRGDLGDALEEKVSRRTEDTGGKGGVGGNSVTTTTYSYFGNFAVGLCEGEIGTVLRVWADGKPLDLDGVTYRIYRGSEDQEPDALIVAKEGAGNAPAYRGLAYVVFERLALEDFGNRIPQLSFELVRPVGDLENMVRAVTLIPGSTEFGYEPVTVTRRLGPGNWTAENRHVTYARSDVTGSLDELQALCPALERVAIVVTWFGSDLRAGACQIRPGVESDNKNTHKFEWSVAGIDRSDAYVVSQIGGRPAFGGTPCDVSVQHLIRELKLRDLKITLYPFVMMDIPEGNVLPDPWSGATSQPVYPWRGRITCDPAPGQPGSPDGSAAAADQIADFFGDASAGYRQLSRHGSALRQSGDGGGRR